MRSAHSSIWYRISICAAFIVPVTLFTVHATRFSRWLIDDALISFAYARTISEGGGIAQQPGATPSEGYSNPTWTFLLAGLRKIGVFDAGHTWFGVPDYVAVIRILGVVFFIGTLLAFWLAARALFSKQLAVAAVAIGGTTLACVPSYVIWAIGGLENPLYGFLIALLGALLVRAVAKGELLAPRYAIGTSVIVLFAAATRPDGVIYYGAYPLLILLHIRQTPLRQSARALLTSAATFAIPAGLFLLWRHATFGLWVPLTAVAKGQDVPTLKSLEKLADIVTIATPLVIIVFLLVVLATFVRIWFSTPTQRDEFLPAFVAVAIPFLLAVTAFVVLNRDWASQMRFGTPIWVSASLVFALCVTYHVAVSNPTPATRTQLTKGGLAILVASMLFGPLAWTAGLAQEEEFRGHPSANTCIVVDGYGRTFNYYADELNLPDSSTILEADIGGLLMTSRLRVVDLAGLTDPTIARYRKQIYQQDRAVGSENLRNYIFDDLKPTFMRLQYNWYVGLEDDPRLTRDYVKIFDSGLRPSSQPDQDWARKDKPGQDWVRKDALAPNSDVDSLRAIAKKLHKRYVARYTRTNPLGGCGNLHVGGIPTNLPTA